MDLLDLLDLVDPLDLGHLVILAADSTQQMQVCETEPEC